MAADLEAQLTLTRQQMTQRVQMGDRLDVARQVEHSAEFRRKGQAEEAASELESLGYTTSLGKRGLLKTMLEASRLQAIDGDLPEALTREVFDIVRRHGGDYDGWGAAVERC